MKLFREIISENVAYLEEGAGNHYIEGIFLQSNIRNRNGRVYPKGVLVKEVTRYTNDKIKNNTAYGELSHPDTPVINLNNVSHLITQLREEGDNFYGKARLLPTPKGDIVRGIMSAGGRIGVSSRAMGSLIPRDDGAMEVQEDLHISTAADIVADPSAPNAYVKSLMEDAEWIFDERHGWQTLQVAEKQQEEFHKNWKKIDEEVATAAFRKFLSSL